MGFEKMKIVFSCTISKISTFLKHLYNYIEWFLFILNSEPVETSRNVTKKTVQRELVYGTDQGGKVIRSRQQSPTSIRRSDREGSVTRETAYTIDDGKELK